MITRIAVGPMPRTACGLFAYFFLILGSASACSEPHGTPLQLEHLMHGDTPAEFEALASYYRTKAADARALAQDHRAMANRAGEQADALPNVKEHCYRIAELNEELAPRYESLAKEADAAALLARASQD
ncbi:MAG: hypothetical protein GWN37_14485 [Gammaproteobacteria bacterium]|nr:hypothetical protein [Gammaproteobacteria bacterium]